MESPNMATEMSKALDVARLCLQCRCGCCKDECPMYSAMLEETISPKGRNAVINAVLRGVVDVDERVVRIAYSCLLCRRDEMACSAQLKNSDATEAFRAYLVESGAPLLREHDVLLKSLENYGNPWQSPKSGRKRWAKKLLDRKAVPGKTDTLFYVGCTFALDGALQEGPQALASIMEKANEKYGLLLDDEICCGSTAKRTGHIALFDKLRKENEKRIMSLHVSRIVTGCAGCFKTLKQDCPNLAKSVQILHSTEYLAGLVDSGRVKFERMPIEVTYHDPCHLGRHTGVYDAPRKVLKSIPGLRLVEMKNSREYSRCCGGGAGVKTAYPEISRKAAMARLKEAEETGAEALVTTCPFCVQTLRMAAQETHSKLEVVELSVLVDRAMRSKAGD